MTADVTVNKNANEIRDYKYVSKSELQAMFDEPGKYDHCVLNLYLIPSPADNSFTPWFKLIARDFLFGWWDHLVSRRDSEGNVYAQSLAGVVDGTKVVKMT